VKMGEPIGRQAKDKGGQRNDKRSDDAEACGFYQQESDYLRGPGEYRQSRLSRPAYVVSL